ncbi:serine hydrolase [Variovorax sp.]|jgi:CubicO group peptidase (beta-lactamase class C family)|uniref:serine hydrolase n=1 Tax=Variovorax sp. TaxID=1871043 RepID=UPI000C3ABE5D|nr:serine hydrolase [Variovorax sp.]MBS77512.1 serine hydrolase [Variovorax sp.]
MVHSSGPSMAALGSELDRLAPALMADWKVPGAALAVVQDGQVVLTRAYGQRDLESGLPVTAATRFLICSITKSFTATALALLHHEGRLDWTRPVRDYLPEFRLHDPVATERVTVRDLLTHHSGLPAHDWMYLPGDRSPARMMADMRHLEPNLDIRTAHQYSNLGYNVLGLLIERVGDTTYEAFIRARLGDRLGMTLGFTLDELEASPEPARPYMVREDVQRPAPRLPFRPVAAGGISTSVAELARWMRLHLGRGEIDGERLLPAALVDLLHAPHVHCPNSAGGEFGEAHYGFGFRCHSYRGDRLVFHGGGLPGWGALMTLVPDAGIGIAVLTNRSPNEGVARPLTWHVIDRLRGREPIDWRDRGRVQREQSRAWMQAHQAEQARTRHPGTRPAHALEAYAGHYLHPAYGLMTIEARDETLHWSWRGLSAALRHRHHETFELPAALHPLLPDGLPLSFLTDRDANVVSLCVPFEPLVKDIVFVRTEHA